MLGWAIKRGLQNATGATGAGADVADTTAVDDTQIEQPDTPAPVFAVRAFKTALFGTPAPKDKTRASKDNAPAAITLPTNSGADKAPVSPTKPAGILLTPGTATARRKRVSFNRDVRDNAQGASSKGGPQGSLGLQESRSLPRTRLSDALEKARKTGRKGAVNESKPSEVEAFAAADDAWEEVDELDRDPDMTIDLNEPHSRSGKYWKSEFQQYHADAKAEMEKLVKYKQLAKSYAKMKDAEALEYHQHLQEERDKVVEMEARVTTLAAQIATKRMNGSDKDNQDLLKDLTQQTALAVQYRNQVKELDAILKTRQSDSEDRPTVRRQMASPRTQTTLLETQRELKKAREQLRELGDLRKEIRQLKSNLRNAEKREVKVETENKRIAQDLAKANARIESLEMRLKAAEEGSSHHNQEAEDWKRKYELLKDNAKARYSEAEQALRRKDGEISDLRKDIEISKNIVEATGLRNQKSDPQDTINDWTARLDALAGKHKTQDKPVSRPKEDVATRFQRLNNQGTRPSAGGSRKQATTHDFEIREDVVKAYLNPVEDSVKPPVLQERRYSQPSASVSAAARSRTSRKPAVSGAGAGLDPATLRDRKTSSSRRATSDYRSREIHRSDRLGSVLPIHDMREENKKQRPLPGAALADRQSHRPMTPDSDDPGIDLVDDKFARLGGPDVDTSAAWAMNTSRSLLPADRRAAAIARIEQKRSERRRQKGDQTRNKGALLA